MRRFVRTTAVVIALAAGVPLAAARPGGEPDPGKIVCKELGYLGLGYENQGQCVKSFTANIH